ncbi:MAG: outer membrane protein assembly factor BamE [Proteobacteria bacterium]|jgi:outer membrane protein assembly factor BamE|nr:outer membrane protein assembly factor BamE [Pseudomonadota bacterium]
MIAPPRTHARIRCRVMLAALAASLSACATFDEGTRSMADAITLYKPEVVQGNFVSKEQVEALQPGMTRLQTRDLLGTPLLTSLFHADRWDYVFTLRRQGVEPQHYRLTLYFKGDALERFEGDDMPSEAEFVRRISRDRKIKIPVMEATEEQLAKYHPSAVPTDPAAKAADTPAPATRSYPPLETSR